jgi:hypothetical protein
VWGVAVALADCAAAARAPALALFVVEGVAALDTVGVEVPREEHPLVQARELETATRTAKGGSCGTSRHSATRVPPMQS